MPINVNKINQNNDYNVGKPKVDTQWSAINMNATYVGEGNMGLLIPMHYHYLSPGQRISINQDVGMQFNPFVSNLFHEIDGEVLSVFCPYRLLWEDWETFIVGGVDGQDATEHPTFDLKTAWEEGNGDDTDTLLGTLADHFDMPINTDFDDENYDGDTQPIAWPWYCYNKYWNEHIRYLDVAGETDEVDLDNNLLLRAHWDHDYFTRSRVYQQRGVVPTVPVSDELLELEHTIDASPAIGAGSSSSSITIQHDVDTLSTSTSGQYNTDLQNALEKIDIPAHELDELGMSLNDFMISMGIMRVYINNAKVQPRYIEHLQARWGIYPQDARLQRPEYLGSNYFNVSVNGVTQTGVGTEGTTQLGDIMGQAIGVGSGMRTNYTAQEHGIIMTMFVIRPKSVYEGGLQKRNVKTTRFDYPTPELANLPDVEVYRRELMYTGISGDTEDETVFGWQGIYEEERTLMNQVRGRMRPSQDDDSHKTFTLARYWTPASPPALNSTFLQCMPDTDRIKVYQDEPDFKYWITNIINTALPLPIQSEPGDLSFI
jgi:hypothetical protein